MLLAAGMHPTLLSAAGQGRPPGGVWAGRDLADQRLANATRQVPPHMVLDGVWDTRAHSRVEALLATGHACSSRVAVRNALVSMPNAPFVLDASRHAPLHLQVTMHQEKRHRGVMGSHLMTRAAAHLRMLDNAGYVLWEKDVSAQVDAVVGERGTLVHHTACGRQLHQRIQNALRTFFLVDVVRAQSRTHQEARFRLPRDMGSRPLVAVLEPAGVDSVSVAVLMSLSDAVRAGVGDALGNRALVLTRENIDIMLDPRAKCPLQEGSCDVDTGRSMGAALIVSGQVTVVDGTLFATLKLYETASGRLLGTQSVHSTSQLGLLKNARTAAKDLVDGAVAF